MEKNLALAGARVTLRESIFQFLYCPILKFFKESKKKLVELILNSGM